VFRKLILLAIVIFIANSFYSRDHGGTTKAASSAPSSKHSTGSVSAPVVAPPRWRYVNPTDAISGKSYRLAQVKSVNSLALDYPYRGANFGTLSVRQHPQFGLDVIVSVEKGQILCPGDDYWTCVFMIRFDEGEPERFTAKKAADGSSTVVFAAYPKWALQKLRAAKKITVQLLMYQSGNQVLTFEVEEPLDW